jgi:hypothetical protein
MGVKGVRNKSCDGCRSGYTRKLPIWSKPYGAKRRETKRVCNQTGM